MPVVMVESKEKRERERERGEIGRKGALNTLTCASGTNRIVRHQSRLFSLKSRHRCERFFRK